MSESSSLSSTKDSDFLDLLVSLVNPVADDSSGGSLDAALDEVLDTGRKTWSGVEVEAATVCFALGCAGVS